MRPVWHYELIVNLHSVEQNDGAKRALIMGALSTVPSVSAMPFPLIGGFLYSQSPPLPFYLKIGFSLIGLLLLLGLTSGRDDAKAKMAGVSR